MELKVKTKIGAWPGKLNATIDQSDIRGLVTA
jgi:hypothetical protein